MLFTTIGAFAWQIYRALTSAEPSWLVVGIDVVLVVLSLFVLAEAWTILRRLKSRPATA